MAKKSTRASDAYAARLADLKTASRAIGDTYAARLAWVIRFIGENPETWHPAVAVAHGDCLHAIGLGGFPPSLVGDIDLPDPLTAEEVADLHRELCAMLRDLLGKNPDRGGQLVMIPTEGQTEGLIRLTLAGKKPAMYAVSRGQTTARTAIFQAIKDLILRAGDRLIACLAPGCGAPFIAIRKQEYCSPRCAQRVRNQKRPDSRPRTTVRRKAAR
jgi:hypothetical protein